MRKIVFGSAFFATVLYASIATACEFCSPTITMTPLRAECFEVQFNGLVLEAEATSAGFVIVDLENCMVDENGKVVLRGVQAGLSRPSNSQLSEAKKTVVMDKTTLVCMRVLIDRHREALSPEMVFQMRKACQ